MLFAEISSDNAEVVVIAAISSMILTPILTALTGWFTQWVKLKTLEIEVGKATAKATDASEQSKSNSVLLQGVQSKQQEAVQEAMATKATVAKTNEVVSQKLDKLADTSGEKLKLAVETVSVLKEVHKNTNGAMTVALNATAEFARRLAEATKAPADVLAAVDAERKFREHAAKQAEIGSADGTTLKTV